MSQEASLKQVSILLHHAQQAFNKFYVKIYPVLKS
jgi:hypothetical protein